MPSCAVSDDMVGVVVIEAVDVGFVISIDLNVGGCSAGLLCVLGPIL